MKRKLKLGFLAACKLLGLFHLAKHISGDRLKILCYHGFALADEAQFRPKLFITPEVFRQRLDVIQRYGMRVIPLGEAVEQLYAGKLPRNSLVITIDDGFHSVSRLAAPELARRGLCSTVYVTSYYVEHATPVYRLIVQYMFWKARKAQLECKDLAWWPDGGLDLSDPAQREAACDACIEFGEKSGNEARRVQTCEQLGSLLGLPYAEIVQQRLLHLMTPEELRALGALGMDVQLHTHRHNFPLDDGPGAQREIEQNRQSLSQWLPGPFEHFCYPSGEWHERQFPWLDAVGVKSSTTCLPGLNDADTPRHALRRFLDGENIHPLEFEAAVSGFSDLLRRGG